MDNKPLSLCEICQNREFVRMLEEGVSDVSKSFYAVNRCGIFKDKIYGGRVIECSRYIKRVSSQEIRFVKHANGIIQDTKTGLEWFVGPDEDIDHYKAEKWVNNLDINGGGWRMPTLDELSMLYDKNKTTGKNKDVCADPVFFSDWKGVDVWAEPGHAYCFSFTARDDDDDRVEIIDGLCAGLRAMAVRKRGEM